MNSSMIGKILKAKRYEQEPDRVVFGSLKASFRGEHDTYHVTLEGEDWHCSCNFFAGWHTCSHVMAMQRMLAPMLPPEARYQRESKGDSAEAIA